MNDLEKLSSDIETVVKRFSANASGWHILRKELLDDIDSMKSLVELVDKAVKEKNQELIKKN